MKAVGAVMGGALLGPLAAGCGGGGQAAGGGGGATPGRRPNILLVLTDQMRLPPPGYAADEGEAPGIKEIFGFANEMSPDNPFARFFPGILRLRRNGMVLRRHYIASAACAPSRTTFLTGQYPSLHGVDQVDGLFKDATEIQFLDPDGVPTVGDWFRAAGYDTHYFGKWHVSHVEEPYSLEPWGFGDWETSGPEPHGQQIYNQGVYRDPGFTENVTNFFQQKGANPSDKPWFAVASLVNPHDIALYPSPFYLQGNQAVTPPANGTILEPQLIPPQGRLSNPNTDPDPSRTGEVIPLNPDGFPQDCFSLPQTMLEDLSTKPDCHLEQAWKVQVALIAQFGQGLQLTQPYPLQRNPRGQEWALRYGQFYVYLQYLVDLELRKIFQAFDESGLAEDTIVVFTSDHGEYGMAHGQALQKWHTAYEENVRVPFVVSSPLVNADPDVLKEVELPSSHIDLAPTLLGFAGVRGAELENVKNTITGHTQVRDLVGTDLTPYLLGQAAGAPDRPGVLYTTDDRITELPDGVANPVNQAAYDLFLQDVDNLVLLGAPLAAGPVLQPNSCRMLADGEWKLNRYLDPRGVETDQWEFYHLASDPRETANLVDFRTGQLRPDAAAPGLTQPQLQAKLDELKQDLQSQEERMLLTPV